VERGVSSSELVVSPVVYAIIINTGSEMVLGELRLSVVRMTLHIDSFYPTQQKGERIKEWVAWVAIPTQSSAY